MYPPSYSCINLNILTNVELSEYKFPNIVSLDMCNENI